jgi:hypothetical protein
MTLGPITQINAARRAREEHKLSCPWDHVEVSFRITTRKSREELKAIFNEAQTRLPEGWHCHKIYFAANDMPVERVDFVITGMPRFADGAAVRALLNMIQ